MIKEMELKSALNSGSRFLLDEFVDEQASLIESNLAQPANSMLVWQGKRGMVEVTRLHVFAYTTLLEVKTSLNSMRIVVDKQGAAEIIEYTYNGETYGIYTLTDSGLTTPITNNQMEYIFKPLFTHVIEVFSNLPF